MAKHYFSTGPQHIHPEEHGAIGSRNSDLRKDRNEYIESQLLVDEAVNKMMHYLDVKLPPEVLEKLCVSGNLKEVLYNYFNQGFQNMYNRYIVTAEDEMIKKVSSLITAEEKIGAEHADSRKITDIIDSISGKETTTQSLDKTTGNIHVQVQKHLDKGVKKLEREMIQTLYGQVGISAFAKDDKAYTVVKCKVGDDPVKTDWVNNVDLVINIKESDLLTPLYHYQVTTGLIFKDLLSTRVMVKLDEIIDAQNFALKKDKKQVLTETEEIAEKLKHLDQYVSFDEYDEQAPQYEMFSKNLLETLETITAEIPVGEKDALSVRENIQKVMEHEHMRSKGFDQAVNALTYYLDTTGFGYQNIVNFKNARRTVIQEYKETDPRLLPDEHYTIELTYYDAKQIEKQRKAYSKQYNVFTKEVDKVYNIINSIIESRTEKRNVPLQYEELAQRVLSTTKQETEVSWFERVLQKPTEKTVSLDMQETPNIKKDIWKDIIPVDESDVNQTFQAKRSFIDKKIEFIYQQVSNFYQLQNPKERKIIDERLTFLQEKIQSFNRLYNPFQIQPGLVVVVHLSTIKQKGVSMDGLSYVMRKFIEAITTGFQDMAVVEHKNKKEQRA